MKPIAFEKEPAEGQILTLFTVELGGLSEDRSEVEIGDIVVVNVEGKAYAGWPASVVVEWDGQRLKRPAVWPGAW